MAKKGDPQVLRYVVRVLRLRASQSQTAFGRACGVSQGDVSRFERGEDAPAEEVLRRMARAANVNWPLVVHLRAFFEAFVAAADHAAASAPGGEALEGLLLNTTRLAIAPYLLEQAQWAEVRSAEEERREAQEVCTGLRAVPAPQRRPLLETALRAAQSTALVMELCEESMRAAANDPADALELANLALFITDRLQVEEAFRSRLQGYVYGFLANAWRVLEDFEAADAAFARAWVLWQAGTDPERLLPDWRLLDLEASLRRDQRRFEAALTLLERALAACEVDTVAFGRILLNKGKLWAQMGDFDAALAALAEAALLVETSQDPRLMSVLRFNTVSQLYHLGRYAEAADLLPAVRELVTAQANDLDLVRFAWLESRVNAGLGRVAEALAGLEQVRADFTARKLPYDAALSSLDLAVLWLEQGRRAEVRELAVGMAWIFSTKGIHREALASLRLFAEAARHDKATAGLARQVIAEIEKVRRTAPPLPKKEGRKV